MFFFLVSFCIVPNIFDQSCTFHATVLLWQLVNDPHTGFQNTYALQALSNSVLFKKRAVFNEPFPTFQHGMSTQEKGSRRALGTGVYYIISGIQTNPRREPHAVRIAKHRS